MVKQRKSGSPKPIVKRKPNTQLLKKLALAILITILAALIYTVLDKHTESAKNLQKLEQTRIQLNVNKEKLQAEIKAHGATDAAKQQQIEELNKKLEETQKQLEAKRASKTVYAASAPAPVITGGTTNCGTDPYMAQIYMRESGCRTNALNSIGCFGIGQSCPASKIAHCGTDFACQDAWFKSYAISRYGSYAGAWSAWQSKHWW